MLNLHNQVHVGIIDLKHNHCRSWKNLHKDCKKIINIIENGNESITKTN